MYIYIHIYIYIYIYIYTYFRTNLPILERFYIKKLKPDLNRQIDNSAFYLIGL